MARAIFVDYESHYHANPLFARDKILDGYAEWAARHVEADDGSAAWLVERDGELAGFSCYRIDADGTAIGVLNGVLPAARGRGVYRGMLHRMLEHFAAMGARRFEIATQTHNTIVQRVWAESGLSLLGEVQYAACECVPSRSSGRPERAGRSGMRESQGREPASVSEWGDRVRRFVVGRSLEACIDSGRDNVLQLRILAAVMVIFGHSFGVLGGEVGSHEPLHYLFPGIVTHITGVNFFFTISGLLITLSWLRRPDLFRFLRARFLRIWPALAVCIAVTAFVIGPLVTTLPLHAYFVDGDAYGTPLRYFLGNVALQLRPFLPGVFEHVPVPHWVNGSLWTLPVEATMYLCVAGLGVLRVFRVPWLASIGIVCVFAYLVAMPAYLGRSVPIEYVQAGFFGAGCIACLLRRYVPVSSGLMLLVLAACIVSRYGSHVMPLTWLAIGYFVLWFCYVPRLPEIPGDVDLSYGTYLYAFPVQQILVMKGIGDPLLLFAIATPIALAIAALSWFFVEKPALRLKDARWPWLRPRARSDADSSVEAA